MIEAITTLIQDLNPSQVDWRSTGAIFIYALRWVGIILVFGLIVFASLNIRKITSFTIESWNELKKVEWLGRRMTIQYSIIVVAVLILFTGFITLTDEVFLFVRTLIISV